MRYATKINPVPRKLGDLELLPRAAARPGLLEIAQADLSLTVRKLLSSSLRSSGIS